MRRFVWVILALSIGISAVSSLTAREEQRGMATIALADLPKEARQTIVLIRKGGPFPYKRDGIVFGNFERRLPAHERGYYREFTVRTPGSRDRGARRVISGKAGELYYSDDHYESFKRVLE